MLKMKKFRFVEDGLAGDVYFDRSRDSFSGLALFAYGFPSFPGPNAVIEALTAAGLVVISPHFRGTYDSEGEFSPESLVSTVEDVARLVGRGYLAQGKDGKHFDLPERWVLIVGHSFGCAAVIRSWFHLKGVEALLLLAPTAHYSIHDPDYGVREDGMAQLDYVRETHPYTYRLAPDTVWRDLFSGIDEPHAQNVSASNAPSVTAVIGEQDAYFDVEVARVNMSRLIDRYVGDTSPAVHVLRGCGHPLAELVNPDTGFALQSFLHDLVARNSSAG